MVFHPLSISYFTEWPENQLFQSPLFLTALQKASKRLSIQNVTESLTADVEVAFDPMRRPRAGMDDAKLKWKQHKKKSFVPFGFYLFSGFLFPIDWMPVRAKYPNEK